MSVKWSYRTLCLSYVLSFFAICISVQSLLSQATIPTLSLPDYESLQMADVYGQAYFSQSLASWSAQVEHYKGILRANWEAAADNAIFTYVDSITISDSFNDVDAYKDYVARELSSQKLEAMGTWEDQANLDFLENYNEFVSRLQTGRLNESYLSRLISQSELNSQNALAQDQNVLLNSINNARSQWEQMMSEQYYQGQYEFMTAKNEIEGKYQDVLSQLDAQEAIFNDNLQEINKYKKVVEGAISSMLTDFEGQLAEACTRSQDCAYRTANNGGLNNAGEKLQEFINKIRAKLNAPVTTTEFYLTDLSDALNTFLKGESSLADSNFIRHRNLTYTYQNTLDASSKTTSAYTFDIGSMIAEVNSGSFEFWRDKLGHVRWYSDNNYGTPQGGFSTELISYIFGRNETGIREFLNRTLRPQGREVEGNVYYNVYARDLGMANKIDPFTWTGIRHNDIDCD
ncbi:TIGR04388 family protein, partial [Leptospira ryugenii]